MWVVLRGYVCLKERGDAVWCFCSFFFSFSKRIGISFVADFSIIMYFFALCSVGHKDFYARQTDAFSRRTELEAKNFQ